MPISRQQGIEYRLIIACAFPILHLGLGSEDVEFLFGDNPWLGGSAKDPWDF